MNTETTPQATATDLIQMKSISDIELLDEKIFFVPDFQRGYRWSTDQVRALMDDIWKFRSDSHDAGKSAFYCLQPVVVARGDHGWVLIDGQQRLTTIYLILSHLKDFMGGPPSFELSYQTRPDSAAFLKAPTKGKAVECPDYYHMYEAYQCIGEWFEEHGRASRGHFFTTLMSTKDEGKNVQVIWYEVPASGTDEYINIFTRLNIGKIPLTNAELIKARLLQRGNFSSNGATLRQIQIATEWDMIEQRLQQDDFWYFIFEEGGSYGPYENRIDFIFDLLYQCDKSNDRYATFYKFETDAAATKDTSGKTDISAVWLKVKRYFQTFEEWYMDRDYYHMIGFLITCGKSVNELKKASNNKTKKQFKIFLRKEIQNEISFDVTRLDYTQDRPAIKRALLLFNVHTIMISRESDARFPFHEYKKRGWDIEHIRSQTDLKITTHDQRHAWLRDLFRYFTGTETEAAFAAGIRSDLSESNHELCEEILELDRMDKPDADRFEALKKKVEVYFGEAGDEAAEQTMDSIGNLALLNDTINRSYKNALFPIKRSVIIERDSKGEFLPICTKNAFMKYYSDRFDQVMYWRSADARAYQAAIVGALNEYKN